MSNLKIKTNFTGSEVDHIYFTSDSHFNHESIIDICKRPYSSVIEMNNDLINRWNSVVKPDDYIFHLGDIIFGGSAVWKEILEQLNGKIILISGNHDYRNFRSHYENYFEYVTDQLQISVDGQPVLLNHYPMLCYGGTYRKNPVYQLHGHVHYSSTSTGADDSRCAIRFPYQYDVGVDGNNFTPLSWNQIKTIIDSQINNYNTFSSKVSRAWTLMRYILR